MAGDCIFYGTRTLIFRVFARKTIGARVKGLLSELGARTRVSVFERAVYVKMRMDRVHSDLTFLSTMPEYAPITLQIVDENGQRLIDLAVPFHLEMDVKQVMEAAFVLMQTATSPDPFLYVVEYYGYSEATQFPGYLGYEIESICGKASNNDFFWKLSINGIPSQAGADTANPGPGSTVLWEYTPVSANQGAVTARSKVVQSRRAARAASKAT
jgi:hypothetical protein